MTIGGLWLGDRFIYYGREYIIKRMINKRIAFCVDTKTGAGQGFDIDTFDIRKETSDVVEK